LTNKSKRTKIIKLVFGLALLLFIGWKLYSSYSKDEFSALVINDNGLAIIVFTILLMPVNWLLESLKWQQLLNTFSPQRFSKTILDVLAGVSTSLITPNRVGNFIGRSLSLDKIVRTKAVLSTIHSNLAQFTASLIFGLVGLFILGFDPPYIDESTIQISAFVMLAVALFIFFYPAVIDFNPLSRMFSNQVKMGIRHVQEEELSLKINILFLSFLRYAVFLLQFYLLLLFFNVRGDVAVIVPAIALVYLVTTIIPSFLFGKLFIREAAALYVLGAFSVETPIILATVFILWFLNLAIPSIIGAVILMKKA
jgi:hypothetical protein